MPAPREVSLPALWIHNAAGLRLVHTRFRGCVTGPGQQGPRGEGFRAQNGPVGCMVVIRVGGRG